MQKSSLAGNSCEYKEAAGQQTTKRGEGREEEIHGRSAVEGYIRWWKVDGAKGTTMTMTTVGDERKGVGVRERA
jgi:hypothetical protein